MIPTPTEQHIVQEVNKPNRIFNSILKLKKEKKEKESILKDLIDQELEELLEAKKEASKKEKEARKNLLAQSRFSESLREIEELKAEIRNDQDILCDFSLSAMFRGEQLNLFDLDTREEYFPEIGVTVKKRK